MQDGNQNTFLVEVNDPKSADIVGKMMVWGMVSVGILAILIKVYGTVIGWYHASVAWLTEAGQYAASFWPF